MSTVSSDIGNSPFIKQLAAHDRPTRDGAVAALKTYLGGKRVFTKIELLKLWKGLFYCMWLSDRPRPQQRLAVDMASLVTVMQEHTVFLFLECFWETMAREWNGIDVLRMNKFLFLVRQYLASSLRYLKVRGWSKEHVDRYMEILQEIPLNPTESKFPNGIRYHMIDIYLDELEKLFPTEAEDGTSSEVVPIDALLKPFEKLVEKSPTKAVRLRGKEMFVDERLKKWGYSRAPTDDGTRGEMEKDEDEWGGFT